MGVGILQWYEDSSYGATLCVKSTARDHSPITGSVEKTTDLYRVKVCPFLNLVTKRKLDPQSSPGTVTTVRFR
jgi:hypothetical protein